MVATWHTATAATCCVALIPSGLYYLRVNTFLTVSLRVCRSLCVCLCVCAWQAWRVYWTPRPTVRINEPGLPHGMTDVAAEDARAARRLASPINHVAKGKPPMLILGKKNGPFLVHILHRTAHFTQTGSGQTSGKHSRRTRFSFLSASATDISAPLPNAERMCVAMGKAGQEYEFENWVEEGHMQITDRVIQRALRFLQERFGVLDLPPPPEAGASKL